MEEDAANRGAVVVSEDNKFTRPAWAAFLLEITLVGCYTEEEIILTGLRSQFSDEWVDVPFEISTCSESTNMTIRPVLDSFEDDFLEWYVSPATTIIPRFAPQGVPIIPQSVTVSSNSDDSSNLLVNSFSYWESAAGDNQPTVIIELEEARLVTSLYIVFRSVGIYVNENVTLPVSIHLQGSTNGITYYLLEQFESSVYEGQEERWLDISDTTLTHLRLTSLYPLSISLLITLSNQYCSKSGVTLKPIRDMTPSLPIVTLDELLLRNLNDNETCICLDTCVLQGRESGPHDHCADERYVGTLHEQYKWGRASVLDLTIIASIIFDTTENVTSGNDGANIYYWTTLTNDIDVTEFNQSIDRGVAQFFNESILYLIPSDDPVASNDTMRVNSNGYMEYWIAQSLVQRGLACPSGTHCTPCGPSNRLSNDPAPGVVCTLDAYRESILADYRNRSDHISKYSAFVTDYIASGAFSVLERFNVTRRHVRLAATPCNNCNGLIECLTGECVTDTNLCPATRYNCPGDGCTQVDVNEKRFKCACRVGRGGLDCSEEYCLPGDPETGKVDPHLWCSCGKFGD